MVGTESFKLDASDEEDGDEGIAELYIFHFNSDLTEYQPIHKPANSILDTQEELDNKDDTGNCKIMSYGH